MEGLSEQPPQSVNPYKALGLSKTASPTEVKTAYKKLALKHHPGETPPHLLRLTLLIPPRPHR